MISSIGGQNGSVYNVLQMQQKMVQEIDSDGDGSITEEEFVSSLSNEMSAEEASEMWSELDTESSGSLTGSEFISAMESLEKPSGPPPGGMAGHSESLSDLFSSIDTDGDGSVTEEELVSNRPEDMSEEQAAEMWSKLDTEGTGSLSESQFASAMESQRPSPAGSGGQEELASSSSSSGTTTEDETRALLQAIEKYTGKSLTGLSADGSSILTSLFSTAV